MSNFDEITELRKCLMEAIEAISIFHGPGWELYRDHSPEMRRWKAVLKVANGGLASGDGSESAGLRRSLTELAAKWRREARGDAGIEECAYELGATIASHPSGHSTTSWKCAARSANTGANDPQDCDWPFCGCDPHAEKVIEIMIESGWSKPALAPAISRPPTQGALGTTAPDSTLMATARRTFNDALKSYVDQFDAPGMEPELTEFELTVARYFFEAARR